MDRQTSANPIRSPSRTAWSLAVFAVLLLGAAARLFLAADRVPEILHRIPIALTLTVALAVAARALRAVTNGGALAGFATALLLFVGAGSGLFAGLVMLFVLTFLGTRWGRAHKERLGTGESRAGRSATQILANTGVAALAAALSPASDNSLPLLAASVGALAEAAADTVSSEYGQAAPRSTILITTGKPVPPGTDGGLSLAGTLSAIVAAAFVVATCVVLGTVPVAAAVPLVLAGTCGMLVDSVLGAVWERRGRLSNDTVNLFGTLSAAVGAFLWFR